MSVSAKTTGWRLATTTPISSAAPAITARASTANTRSHARKRFVGRREIVGGGRVVVKRGASPPSAGEPRVGDPP